MANKFATLVAVIIIALLVYFAFQNFYKPGQFGMQSQNFSISTAKGELLYSTSRQLAAGVTLQHNASLVGGKRFDSITILGSNLSSVVGGGLLVIVPKKLSKNASKIVASGPFEILREDPHLFFDLAHTADFDPETQTFTRYKLSMLYVPESLGLYPLYEFYLPRDMELHKELREHEDGELAGLPYTYYSGPAEDVSNLFDTVYRDQLSELPLDQVEDFAKGVEAILNDLSQTPEDRVSSLVLYLDSRFNPPEEEQTLETPSELELTISEFSPKGRESFSLPRNDRAVSRPELTIRGSAANYHTTATVLNNVVTVDVDLSGIPYAGGLFSFSQITGSIELYYPQTGYRTSIPLMIQVNHVRDATLISPRALPGGVGGELVVIVPNLQRPIEQVVFQGSRQTCGVDSVVDIPAADPANPKAVVLWISQEVKNALRQNGECHFVDQRGGVVPQAITLSTSLTRSNELESLMPFVANLDALQPNQRWNECSEGYCGCTAARQALESAIAKTKGDARKFYGSGYTLYQNKFWRFYLFNLAAVEGCNFGVTPLQGAAPGEIQVVAIGVNPANLNQVIAKSFHGADNIQPISMVQDVTVEEIKDVVLSPWLCFDPNGLPQSLPDNSCSAEQRQQAIAQR